MTSAETYTWSTPEHSIEFTPAGPDLITVSSSSYEAIENFLSTVELAGTEEGTELPELIESEQSLDWGNELTYFVEVSRATVSLFFDFEVRYYIGVPVA